MDIKLTKGVLQTADRQRAFDEGLERELRRRLALMVGGGKGIFSTFDVDVDNAPCALSVNPVSLTTIDVSAGTVVFPNGEYVDVRAGDISGIPLKSMTESNVFRLEYGEVEDGPLTSNVYYNSASKPVIRKKTPREMLVVETAREYSLLPQAVKDASVVIGVARTTVDGVEVDNSRDTYSYNRPWASVVDAEHRAQVGTGLTTPTNPHGTSANDLVVGGLTVWQAIGSLQPVVISRPRAFPKIPGERCDETVPAGSFITDGNGDVTGLAGAFYAFLGRWPHTLLSAMVSTTRVSAWIVPGTNIIAVYDPQVFPVPTNLSLTYSSVRAGALPNSLVGLTQIEVQQPAEGELIVAGGNFFDELKETKVLFSDVGLIPMPFDIVVNEAGEVYKSPQVVLCNALLDDIGLQATFDSQPLAPSHLRVAISNFSQGFTKIVLRILGTVDGVTTDEVVEFSGPIPTPSSSPVENTNIRVITGKKFESVSRVEVEERNGDGPNTTLTVFAELQPTSEREIADHCVLANVHWTGTHIAADYVANPSSAVDLRQVSTGGPAHKKSATVISQDYVAPSSGFFNTLPNHVTIVEDFDAPSFIDVSSDTIDQRVLGFRGRSYLSRKIPVGKIKAPLTVGHLRMLPRDSRHAINLRRANISGSLVLHTTDGDFHSGVGFLGSTSAPFQIVDLSFGNVTGDVYAVTVSLGPVLGKLHTDLSWWQGFVLHLSA